VTGFAVAYTSRVVAEASAGTPVSLFLTFGGIPRRAAARVVSSGTEPGTVRGADTTGLLRVRTADPRSSA